jgi:hypothetical protein
MPGIRADQFFTLREILFNPEPTATANFPQRRRRWLRVKRTEN